MGIKERRMRERLALKDNIILAAKSIAMDEGWNAVTMRKIAEKIEYTPPVIYEHFNDKDELLQEIRREGYRKLFDKYQEVLAGLDDPAQVLIQLGVGYLDFAWQNPELYKVMYDLDRGAAGSKGLEEEIAAIRLTIKDVLLKVFKNAKPVPALAVLDVETAIDILRCMLHGAISLSMIGGLRGDQERARSLAMKGIQDLVTYWMAE